ncbi:MAG: diaminopimelate epimerase [Calditrichia bacterium]
MSKKISVPFIKIHGNGNDFIFFEAAALPTELTRETIVFLADRHKGIGADGILIMEDEQNYDFRMIYYNRDGKRVDFCGNGGRCIAHLAAQRLGKQELKFIADDGEHLATCSGENLVSLLMSPASFPENPLLHEILNQADMPIEGYLFINTGVPHIVVEISCDSIEEFLQVPLTDWARPIRYHSSFPEGVNVNVTALIEDEIYQRTYERGVEDETLSCGTGSVAIAWYWANTKKLKRPSYSIHTTGGINSVSFDKNIPLLTGQVHPVFEGTILL